MPSAPRAPRDGRRLPRRLPSTLLLLACLLISALAGHASLPRDADARSVRPSARADLQAAAAEAPGQLPGLPELDLSALGVYVWVDSNRNGRYDEGIDQGIPDVELRLEEIGGSTRRGAHTNPGGFHLFAPLAGATYRVTVLPETLPPGLRLPMSDPDGTGTPHTALISLEACGCDVIHFFAYTEGDETGRAKVFYEAGATRDMYVDRAGDAELPVLRAYGPATVCEPGQIPRGNRPAAPGSDGALDPATGAVPEDAPYTDPEGPFDPFGPQAPGADVVTWNPAFISERLDEAAGLGWGCSGGLDEVSRASRIRMDGRNGAMKVWLRHWYEPTHLDKDLNADGCLTDLAGDEETGGPDGQPDAPPNPAPSTIDEWYPAIVTELTYLLLENELPGTLPEPASLAESAPRPACGGAGRTRIVFPAGVEPAAADPAGAESEAFGLTSLDLDFDGRPDMLNVEDERTLAAELGLSLDFDGDGALEPLDPDGVPLSCDELLILRSDATRLGPGDRLQLLDHYVEVESVSDGSAVLRVWYTGDLLPRSPGMRATVGIGGAAFASDTGGLQVVAPGGGNLGEVPIGAWFAYVSDVDAADGTAIVAVGRGLGAPCAAMESAPGVANLSPGGPWFLKRVYVDGHEYNTVALMTCADGGLQYVTLRAPLPKVPVIIEQHSVRLRAHLPGQALPLPPPFNHEHTVLEDVYAPDPLDPCPILPAPGDAPEPRPEILYMGGPVGPLPPILGEGDGLSYAGRDPAAPVGPYDLDARYFEAHWFYTAEAREDSFVGQLREKYGAPRNAEDCAPGPEVPDGFFYNERILSGPLHYTSFHLPRVEPVAQGACDPDGYHVATGLLDRGARWRRWAMPDAGVPAEMPPPPPDLARDEASVDPAVDDGDNARRLSFRFDPDEGAPLVADGDGVRLHGGVARCADLDCDGAASRPSLQAGAGDLGVVADPVSGAPVEAPPYTDPFAPFNPQHPDAPRGDSLTFDPAYLDEFRHFGEDLAALYAQLSNGALNARQKIHLRTWYQPRYLSKIREADDCDRDLAFPALVQEYSFLAMDTTDNPVALPPGTSRIAFPLATGEEELPWPDGDGALPEGGDFGHGLTSFDADLDGRPDAVTIHTEQSLAAQLDAAWQTNRPSIPGIPSLPLAGPTLDFDGDGALDDLDEDCVSLNGNEMVVLVLESVTLDRDPATPAGEAAMLLDHLVALDDVSADGTALLRFWFTGGTPAASRPEPVGGVRGLSLGEAAVVDRFQDRVTIVAPGQDNYGGVDGGWFAFVEDVSTDAETVTLTIGRALGASHSAIDDGAGRHDLAPGDPWYLKRFYVDGHEHDVVALMTRPLAGGDPTDPAACNEGFAFLTIRTPVPKGDFFNPQDSLPLQGYFLDGQPPEISVLPPFDREHTRARDVERIEAEDFLAADELTACVGELAPGVPLVLRIEEETVDGRLSVGLREIYHPGGMAGTVSEALRARTGWQVDEAAAGAPGYTTLALPEGLSALLTLAWRGEETELLFYGCTREDPGPFDEDDPPPLDQADLAELAACWREGIVPLPGRLLPPYLGRPADGDWASRLRRGAGATAAPVPAPGPEPEPEPTPDTAALSCLETEVSLQGREDAAGAVLLVDGVRSGLARADGALEACGIAPGPRTLALRRPGYLAAQARIALPTGRRAALPAIELRGGDANDDARIDLLDLVTVGADYGSAPPTRPGADLNEDGAVNLFDLVLVSGNYDLRGPQAWWPGAEIGAEASATRRGLTEPPGPAGAVGPEGAARGDSDAVPSAAAHALRLETVELAPRRWRIDLILEAIEGGFGIDARIALAPGRWALAPGAPDASGEDAVSTSLGTASLGTALLGPVAPAGEPRWRLAEAWGPRRHVARDDWDARAGRGRLAVARLGDGALPPGARLASLVVEPLGPEAAEEADEPDETSAPRPALTAYAVADDEGRLLAASLSTPGDDGRGRVHLPWLGAPSDEGAPPRAAGPTQP